MVKSARGFLDARLFPETGSRFSDSCAGRSFVMSRLLVRARLFAIASVIMYFVGDTIETTECYINVLIVVKYLHNGTHRSVFTFHGILLHIVCRPIAQ